MMQYVPKFKQMDIFYRKYHVENIYFLLRSTRTKQEFFKHESVIVCLHNVDRLEKFFLMKKSSKIAFFFYINYTNYVTCLHIN